MNPLWFIPAVMSVFGGVADYNSGKEMEGLAKQQELLAEENAILEKRELDESVRRQEKKDAQVRGAALAKSAASGARVEGSVSDYLEYIDDEQVRELDWMKTAGASRIRLNKQASINEAKALKIQGKSKKYGLITGAVSAFSFLGQGGMFSSPTSGYNAGSFYTDL